jgi:transcriptional regulator with XRE-family HTH domain
MNGVIVLCVNRTLGHYIKERREVLGLTQTELAERADVPRTTVNRVETGTTKLPSPDIRRRLARALSVPHLDLLIAAGELSGDDIRSAGVVAVEIIEPERAELLAKLELVRLHDQTRIDALTFILDGWLRQDREADNPVKDLFVDPDNRRTLPFNGDLSSD